MLNECYKVSVVTKSKSKPVHVCSTKHMFVISCNKGYQTIQVGSCEIEDSYFRVHLYNKLVINTYPQFCLGLI